MTRAALLLATVALVGCGGGGKPDRYTEANSALLNRLPVYPGAASPKTTAGANSSTQFGARDWTLPAQAKADTVIVWYERKLEAAGFTQAGQTGSHVKFAKTTPEGTRTATVPKHREVAAGTPR